MVAKHIDQTYSTTMLPKIMIATMLARNSIGTEDKNLVLWGYHEKVFLKA